MKISFKKDLSPNSFSIYCINNVSDSNDSILFNLISCGYEEIRKAYNLIRSEFHGNMLTYIVGGSGHLIFKGKHYSLKKDDLILINCIEEHHLYPNNEGMIIYYMHIDNNIIEDFANNIEKTTSAVYNFAEDPSVLDFFKEYIKKDCQTIDNAKISQDLYSILIKIRLKLLGETGDKFVYPVPVKTTIDYIKDNFKNQNLNLETIANISGFNKYYLEKVFRKYFNTTVCNYLCNVRLAHARKLLLLNDMSIEEIAIQSGFSSSQLLIKYFKEFYKETPLQYRKKRIMTTR